MFFPPCHFSWLSNVVAKPKRVVREHPHAFMIVRFGINVNINFTASYNFRYFVHCILPQL